MRIAQIAPLTEPVPPTGHGSIEMIVHTLTEELMRRGHDLTLFASGDSKSTAKLRSSSRLSFRSLGRAEVLMEFSHTVKAFREAAESADIIHNHTEFFGLGIRDLVSAPVLTTIHSPCETPGALDLLKAFSSSPCVALTHAHRRNLPPELNVRFVIPHGLPLDEFPFQAEKEEFLLFLGRLHPIKGADLAIAAAREAGLPLVIAGPMDRYLSPYWDEFIRPHVDGVNVLYVGEMHGAQKLDLVKRAKAVLFPIQMDEPFGMVMIEALACGTPVVALRRGSVSEVLLDGETGFIAETAGGLRYGLTHLHEIDPHRCRADVAERFSIGRMADDYLAAYAKTPSLTQKSSAIPELPRGGTVLIAGELADFFGLPETEAMRKLELAPHMLARAFFEADIRDEDARQRWYGGEPLLAFELASRSLDDTVRQMIWEAVAQGETIGARRWLSYRSDVGNLALAAPGTVDVVEHAGPALDFIRWRLARRGHTGAFVASDAVADLPESAYDVITAYGALEREVVPLATLRSLIRLLRPGGLLLISVAYVSAFDQPWVPEAHIHWHRNLDLADLGLERLASSWPQIFRRPL
ncbi:MAG: glycosyltransferase family 4 protein [Candidatus Sericytochromatia bacterium]|nr:glycosyltransferase family 4 protein [Candidatus Sericytochromatia bacterium]